MRSALARLPGHPDAVCDIVAETVVDEYVRRDPATRIRLSVSGGRGALFVSGDVKSTADFDVSSVIRRSVGALGIMADIEPFISLDPVGSEQSALFLQGSGRPVSVYGYATAESEELMPTPISIARHIVKRLEDLRSHDEKWFWLGADGEVLVQSAGNAPLRVSLLVEQGTKALTDVRSEIAEVVSTIAPNATIETNVLGCNDTRGLAHLMGASGREMSMYGLAMPAVIGCIGTDPRDPHKAGAWLARAAARSLIKRGAKAVMVQCVYSPGEQVPSYLRARDEHGKDLSALIPPSELSLDRVMAEWWRPGLGIDAARWGFAGAAGLPWEC